MKSRRRKGGATALPRAALEASIDRDDARAKELAQTPRPSSSEVMQRCAVCGRWPRFDRYNGALCVATGEPGHRYAPQAPIGLAVVR